MYQNFEKIYGNLIDYVTLLGAQKAEFKTKLIFTIALVIVLAIVLVSVFVIYKDSYVEKIGELQLVLTIVGIIFAALFIFALINLGSSRKTYNKIFKKEILPKLLRNIDENLNYEPSKGLPKEAYVQSGLSIKFNQFGSEDHISGFISETALLEMSEIDARMIEKDDKGNAYIADQFNGILAVATLRKNAQTNVKIVKNSFWKLSRQANIRIASVQFEKYFDVYADDKVAAMQIFTTDVIEEIMAFVEELKIHLQLSIKGNKLYITFKTGEMYEGGITKNTKELLSRYYVITDFIVNLIKRINIAIDEAEI